MKTMCWFLFALSLAAQTYGQSVWTQRVSGVIDTPLCSVAWTGDKLVVVGRKGVVLTSPDGIIWTRQNSGTSAELTSVIWTGSQLVAAGNIILTSPDGVVWMPRSSDITYDFWLQSVTWIGNQFVGVGKHLMTSPDGIAWILKPLIPDIVKVPLFGATWTGSKLIAVGSYGTLATTTDGIMWTEKILADWSGHVFQAIVATENQIVIAGDMILTAPDGNTWTRQNSDMNPSPFLYSIIWTGYQFVAVGGKSTVLTSPDGITWARKTLPVSNIGLNSVVFTGTQFVAVGSSGEIVTSPKDGLNSSNPPTLKTNNKFEIRRYGTKLFVTVPVYIKGNNIGVKIYSVAGKMVLEKYSIHNNGKVELDIKNLASGRYAFVISYEGLRFLKPFCIFN